MPGDIPLVNMPISFFNTSLASDQLEANLKKAVIEENTAIKLIIASLLRNELSAETLDGLIATRLFAALIILHNVMNLKNINSNLFGSTFAVLRSEKSSEDEFEDFNFGKLEGIKQILLDTGKELASSQLLTSNPHLIEFFTLHQLFWQRMIEARLVTYREEASSSERRLSR